MKKKKNNGIKTSSFIIAAGIIVLIVFAFVTVINLLPNYESNSYYVKVDKEISAKIESINKVLSSFFNYCKSQNWISINPASKELIELPR